MAQPKTASPRGARAGARTTTAASRATARKAGAGSGRGANTTPSRASAAERVVLVPLGAALIARDRIVTGVGDALEIYSTPSKASAQLRRFERRGSTARKRLEREVRKTRVRVEREVRRRRRGGEELADRVQERILSLV